MTTDGIWRMGLTEGGKGRREVEGWVNRRGGEGGQERRGDKEG